jgi:3'(2'), 5'-bisphosphate nucleotidase
MAPYASLVQELVSISKHAGRVILDIYHSEFEVRGKDDSSPVTDADEQAEALILQEVQLVAPDIAVVAEESVAAGQIPDISSGRFFLVDPLDGTREFINRNGEFTVNIGLIDRAYPVAGVVHLPALGETFWSDGEQAWRQRGDGDAELITCRSAAADGLVVVASRSHRDARTAEYLAKLQVKQLISAGSSLKLCRLAEGKADLYPRLGRTMEWDIAAGHAVLAAAGGSVCTLDGQPMKYGKPGLENPDFVAQGKSTSVAG